MLQQQQKESHEEVLLSIKADNEELRSKLMKLQDEYEAKCTKEDVMEKLQETFKKDIAEQAEAIKKLEKEKSDIEEILNVRDKEKAEHQ